MPEELEYTTRVLPIDANVQIEINKLVAEGWVPTLGATPVAIWHLQRPKVQLEASVAGAHGGITVKDDGVFVVKGNGQG